MAPASTRGFYPPDKEYLPLGLTVPDAMESQVVLPGSVSRGGDRLMASDGKRRQQLEITRLDR